jgi:hypothetical protein
MGEFRGHPVGFAFGIAASGRYEQQQTRADLADGLVPDAHRGALDALRDNTHGATRASLRRAARASTAAG